MNDMSNTLVAYFTCSGVTGRLADRLAGSIGADIYRIEPAQPYTDADLDWTDKGSRSTLEMADRSSRPAIGGADIDISGYDTVFVGFPIWWYVAPTIVNTFLEAHDLSGKRVVPFATSGGSGMGDTNRYLEPSCRGAELLPGRRFQSGASEDELASWAEGMMSE